MCDFTYAHPHPEQKSAPRTQSCPRLLARLQRAVSPQPPQGAFNMMAGGAELEVPCCVMVLVVCRGSDPGLSASVPSPAGVFLT